MSRKAQPECYSGERILDVDPDDPQQIHDLAVQVHADLGHRGAAEATKRLSLIHIFFVDFNQNAKDRTVASAYSVRATPDARVSTPLRWDEVPGCDPADFTVATVAQRFADIGDPWAGMDDAAGRLDRLLTLAEELGPAERAPKGAGRDGSGRRQSMMPLIEIARTKTKDEAMAALDIWRQRHPAVAQRLQPADILVDGMRGPSSIWYRIRINLQHVAGEQRPPQEELIADYSPWSKPAEPPC